MSALAMPQASGLFSEKPGILTGQDAQAYFERRRQGRTVSAALSGTGIVGLDGRQVNLTLSPSDVHEEEEMSSYLAGYSPARYMSDVAAPLVTDVPVLFDKFRKLTVANAFRRANVLASTQGAINEVDPETEFQNYRCVDRALGGFVPHMTSANEKKAFNTRQALGRRIAWALGLDREIRVFGAGGLLSTSTNFDAANRITIGGGNEWDTTNGDPLANINAAMEASAMPITDWFMSTPSMNAMIQNANFRAHNRFFIGDDRQAPQVTAGVGAGNRDFVIPGYDATFHEVPAKVLNEATGALDFVLTDVCIGIHRPPSGVPTTGEDIITAQTFRFTGLGATDGFITREFDVEDRGMAGGRKMVSGYSEDVVMVGPNVGAIIINTLA